MKVIDQLQAFNAAFENYRQDMPDMDIPDDVKRLRVKLMREELAEVEEAMAGESLLDLAKELADLLYVLIGTVEAYGLSDYFEAVFDEVHRSNMSKLDDDGRPIYREDGKVLKSNRYTSPDLRSILPPNTN